MSLSEKKIQDLIAYVEARGWTTQEYVQKGTTLFRKLPRFSLYFVRKVEDPLLTIHSLSLRVGSGRVSGIYSRIGWGSEFEKRIGNWNDARTWASFGGVPTPEEQERAHKLKASHLANDLGDPQLRKAGSRSIS